MEARDRDRAADALVRFSVRRVDPTPERLHGLDYSLTLHGPDGSRLVGFDNAHPVRKSHGPGAKSPTPYDHKHKMDAIRPYRSRDAASLLEEFWGRSRPPSERERSDLR